jgi:glycosyltransferase involved in cell wall biosynthesis
MGDAAIGRNCGGILRWHIELPHGKLDRLSIYNTARCLNICKQLILQAEMTHAKFTRGEGTSTQKRPIGAASGAQNEAAVLVIPAYKPSPSLPEIVNQLIVSSLINHVVVVNDGSGLDYISIFDQLSVMADVTILHHMVNLGKGAALRTGFNFAGCVFPASVGVVTADADGQHLVPDILAVADALARNGRALVVGARQLEGDIPFRSKFGNTVTRYVMRAVTGQRLHDTQTGLRGIPMDFIPILLKSTAAGYEFELDMLVTCKYTARQIREIPISTVYLDGNKSSHFNPLIDSMKIYFVLLRFMFVSFTTAILDNLVFFVALNLFPHILLSQAIGRFCAGVFNYYVNKNSVFHSRRRNIIAVPRYWFSVAVFGALSYIIIQSLLAYTSLTVVAAKLLAETVTFFFSFFVQRDFVFNPTGADTNEC